MSRQRAGLVVFLLLTFGLAWAIEIGLTRRWQVGSTLYIIALVAVMFVPGLSALFVRVFVERQGFADAGLRWGRGRYYLAAWLLPVVFGAVAFGLAIWLRQAEFDPWMTELMVQIKTRVPETKLPPFARLRVYVILGSLTQAVLINTIPAFGEEFGWRGYLLMRLLPLGAGRAMVLTGAIWGLWHAPIILQGHNYPDHPALGVPLMIGFCILLGVIFGWLRLASGSVFAAAVAHASINGPANTPLLFLRVRNDITAGMTGLLGQAVMLAFVLLIWGLGALRIQHSMSKGEENGSGSMPESAD
ncbi:MAG: CPBP family intramembrane metalloprotease [Armatimonadota bacterium]|nr:MAG: CPBP family intramembrane metalloprotease [Armatimonadota bacterium]